MALGLGFCLLVASLATYLGMLQHYVGAPIIGLFIGVLASSFLKTGEGFAQGTEIASKHFLKGGIMLLGATLNIFAVMAAGADSLPLILLNVCASFAIAFLVGKHLGLSLNIKSLVGAGGAICGGTAIATLSPIIKAKGEETAYAMAAIFFLDFCAILFIPYIAAWMLLTPSQYGFIGGLTIFDTSSVVAAGITFDNLMGAAAQVNGGLTAGGLAVTVKLVRTTMLIVLAVVFSFLVAHQTHSASDASAGFSWKGVAQSFPLFILGFIAFSVANTTGFIPAEFKPLITLGYKFLITCALVAIGFKINFKKMLTSGLKPVLLGWFVWVGITALTVAYVVLFVK